MQNGVASCLNSHFDIYIKSKGCKVKDLDGKTYFKKPISCHLFPVRIKEYNNFDAVNYENIKICKPACECGSKLKVPLYKFLKEPLIRKYGKKWYKELLEAAELLD